MMWHLHHTTWFFYHERKTTFEGIEYNNCITLETIKNAKPSSLNIYKNGIELEKVCEKGDHLYGWKNEKIIFDIKIN